MVRKVVVGISGGVDSAVSALLLKRAGYEVVGLFMKNWEDDDDGQYCTSRQDLIDAAAACDVIGIDLEAVNFAKEYKDRVFSGFLREYSAGRTPNPDVLCNAEIKFRAFLDHAVAMGADAIATGHYALTGKDGGKTVLLKGRDPGKDQSYFLHRLNQEQVSRVLFPVGGMLKKDVRRIAAEAGLPNAGKKDSTGICFIGERPFREFLSRYLPSTPGPIRNDRGEVIGEHMGLSFYTIGQRKGIGIGGRRDASEEPWFVARKDLKENALYVVQGHGHPWLVRKELQASLPSWVAGVAPREGERVAVKTRYRQADASARIAEIGEEGFTLAFDEPQWAVTPGQSAVLYKGDVCLGGGFIENF